MAYLPNVSELFKYITELYRMVCGDPLKLQSNYFGFSTWNA